MHDSHREIMRIFAIEFALEGQLELEPESFLRINRRDGVFEKGPWTIKVFVWASLALKGSRLNVFQVPGASRSQPRLSPLC